MHVASAVFTSCACIDAQYMRPASFNSLWLRGPGFTGRFQLTGVFRLQAELMQIS